MSIFGRLILVHGQRIEATFQENRPEEPRVCTSGSFHYFLRVPDVEKPLNSQLQGQETKLKFKENRPADPWWNYRYNLFVLLLVRFF